VKHKVLWLDTETTGVDHRANAPIQIAALATIGYEEVGQFEALFQPWKGAAIEDQALAVNKRTREEIETFMSARDGWKIFAAFMGGFVNKFDKADKFWLMGYNVGFDLDMLRTLAEKCGEKYLMSYIYWPPLCVAQQIAAKYPRQWAAMPSRKLGAVCEAFGVELGDAAHDAMADVRAVKKLWEVAIRDAE